MDLDLEQIDGKTYTRPSTELRRAEVRHMLNGYVTKVIDDPAATLNNTLEQRLPLTLAVRLVSSGALLRMNYRIVTVGTGRMLLGRPIREDA